LITAVLQDAVQCLEHADGNELREAHRWVMSDEIHWPFSFRNICSALDLDPLTVRRLAKRPGSAPV
jgi:hypothetical protein